MCWTVAGRSLFNPFTILESVLSSRGEGSANVSFR